MNYDNNSLRFCGLTKGMVSNGYIQKVAFYLYIIIQISIFSVRFFSIMVHIF